MLINLSKNLEYIGFTAADYKGYAIYIYNENLLDDTHKIFVFKIYKTLAYAYNFTYSAFYC